MSMIPSDVTSIKIDKKSYSYTRIGSDGHGWQDGITPLNSDNLNKGDTALYSLLKENDGLVFTLVDTINSEISSRKTDVINLDHEIQSEITNAKNALRGKADDSEDDVTLYGTRAMISEETNKRTNEDRLLKNSIKIIQNSLSDDGTIGKKISAAQSDATQALEDIEVIQGEGNGSIAKAVANALEEAKSYTDEQVSNLTPGPGGGESENVKNHIANKNNPHEVTPAQVGLGNVDNKSVDQIKSEFTGDIADNNTGFVTGSTIYQKVILNDDTLILNCGSSTELVDD